MKLIKAFIFSFFLMQFGIANERVIKFEDFVHFSKTQKVQTVKLIHEYLIEYEKLEKELSSNSKQQSKKHTFNKIFNFFINSAYADNGINFDRENLDAGELCFYAGWMSVRVIRNGQSICMHPNKLASHINKNNSIISEKNKPLVRQVVNKYRRTLSGSPVSLKVDNSGEFSFDERSNSCNSNRGDIVCNPTIFGKKSGSPICVQGNSNLGLNSSLLCNQALNVLAQESPEEYATTMDEIVNNATNENKDEFFYILDSMYDTCLCGKDATSQANEGRFQGSIDARYAEVMFNQRTCYGLINQTEHIFESIQQLPSDSAVCSAFERTPLNSSNAGVNWLNYLNDAYRKIQEQDIRTQLTNLISQRRNEMNNSSSESQRDGLRSSELELFSGMRESHFEEYIEAGLCPTLAERENEASDDGASIGGADVVRDNETTTGGALEDGSNINSGTDPNGNSNSDGDSENENETGQNGDTNPNDDTSNTTGTEDGDNAGDDLIITAEDGSQSGSDNSSNLGPDSESGNVGGGSNLGGGSSGGSLVAGGGSNLDSDADQGAVSGNPTDNEETTATENESELYFITLLGIEDVANDSTRALLKAKLEKNVDGAAQLVEDPEILNKFKLALFEEGPEAEAIEEADVETEAEAEAEEETEVETEAETNSGAETTEQRNLQYDLVIQGHIVSFNVRRLPRNIKVKASIEIDGNTYISSDTGNIKGTDTATNAEDVAAEEEQSPTSEYACTIEIEKSDDGDSLYKLSTKITVTGDNDITKTYPDTNDEGALPSGVLIKWYESESSNPAKPETESSSSRARTTIDSGEDAEPATEEESELDGLKIIAQTNKAASEDQYAQYPVRKMNEDKTYAVKMNIPEKCSASAKIEIKGSGGPVPGNNNPYQIPSRMTPTPQGGGILRGQR